PLVASNKISGPTYGGETFAQWKPVSNWKVSGAFTFLKMDIDRNADSQDFTSSDPAGASPRSQWYVRSSLDLPKNLQHDVTLRYVEQLKGLNIPSYYSVDARVGWKV